MFGHNDISQEASAMGQSEMLNSQLHRSQDESELNPILDSQKQASNDKPPEEEVEMNFKDMDDLKEIKSLLQNSSVALGFNTNILRIALNYKEEKIASVLVAEYFVEVQEEMIIRAIKTTQMFFLRCVWSFNKNYERVGI